jgi:hypothetical protein
MKVQRSHLRIALIVLVIAVAYNAWVFLKPAPRSAALTNRQQPLLGSEVPPASDVQTVDPLSIPAPPSIDVSASPSSGRDPFLFGDERRDGQVKTAADRVPDPVIRSILFSATRRTAIVEDRMLSVGDSIGTLRVVEIDRDAVVFVSADGERRRVALHRASSTGIRR